MQESLIMYVQPRSSYCKITKKCQHHSSNLTLSLLQALYFHLQFQTALFKLKQCSGFLVNSYPESSHSYTNQPMQTGY